MSVPFDAPLPHLPITMRQALALPPPARARVIAYLLRWSEYASAQALLEPVVHLTPESISARAQLCECLIARGDLDGARRMARELHAVAPEDLRTLAVVGDVLAAEGRLDRAESYYRRCTRENRLTPHALRRLATCRLRAGRAEEALALATSLRVLHETERPDTPVPVPLLRLLASAAGAAGRHEEAEAVRGELEERRRCEDARMRDFLAAWPAADRVRESRAAYAAEEDPRDALRRLFGYREFRPGQEEIVRALLAGEHVLAVLPTGAGKSVCYQLPALLRPGTTLVISPLISLMQDQLGRLPPAASRLATCFHGGLEPGEAGERLRRLTEGQCRLVYAAPERLRQIPFLRALQRASVWLMVVDEAHCIVLWGHDFRPDYLFLGEVWERLGRPTTLALTATATPEMQDEIGGQFGIPFRRVRRDAYRPNLKLEAIEARDEPEKRRRLLEVCRETRGAGIVYVRARERAEELAVYLSAHGLPADRYHAGLDAEERAGVQVGFMLGQTRFLVATVAFGMGIDKTNVRLVCHYDLPESPEALFQEVGRAGRDGRPARCVLLHMPADRHTLYARLRHSRPAAERVAVVAAAIRERLQRTQPGGRGMIVRDDLARELGAGETEIRVAISLLEQCGELRRGFDVPRAISLFVRRPPEDPAGRELVEQARLRLRQRLTLETAAWCERLGVSAEALEPRLLDAAEQGWLEYRASGRALWLERGERIPEDGRVRLRALLRRAEAEDTRRFEALLQYVETAECRARFLARYFGTPLEAPCGQCDRCLERGVGVPHRMDRIAEIGTSLPAHPDDPVDPVTASESALRDPHSDPASSDPLAVAILQRLRAWCDHTTGAAAPAPDDLLPEETLRTVAERQPRSAVELEGCGVPRPQVERYGEAILDLVMEVVAAGPHTPPAPPSTRTGPA